jgi:hypothetical protein
VIAAALDRSRWKCPNCGSHRVHVRLPAWFTETAGGDLTHVSTDSEADTQGYYCERCYACEEGAPTPTDEGEQAPASDAANENHGRPETTAAIAAGAIP